MLMTLICFISSLFVILIFNIESGWIGIGLGLLSLIIGFIWEDWYYTSK